MLAFSEKNFGENDAHESKPYNLKLDSQSASKLKVKTAVTGWDKFLRLLHIFGLLGWDVTHS